MSYGDPSSEHRSAVREIADHRQRALVAVSEMAKAAPLNHHTHLAPANDGRDNMAVACTQSVVDYLIQLRPYRARTTNWREDFGVIVLPREISKGGAADFGVDGETFEIMAPSRIRLKNLDDVITVANKTIRYGKPSGVGDFGLETGGTTETYKLVFSQLQLMRIVTLADVIAAELDLLVELEEIDYSAEGGGAV